MALAKNGAALVVKEIDINHEKLSRTVQNLLNNQSQLKTMADASKKIAKPNATLKIIDQAMELIK